MPAPALSGEGPGPCLGTSHPSGGQASGGMRTVTREQREASPAHSFRRGRLGRSGSFQRPTRACDAQKSQLQSTMWFPRGMGWDELGDWG